MELVATFRGKLDPAVLGRGRHHVLISDWAPNNSVQRVEQTDCFDDCERRRGCISECAEWSSSGSS